MDTSPKVSIIIPCYNYGKFLKEAIDSVMSQTFQDFEIIVVNDGSTDNFTIELLSQLSKEYPKIRVIDQDNKGLASARNAGIKLARGEYYVPLDADDKLEPEFLERCLNEIERNLKVAFVYTYTKQFGDTNEVIVRPAYNFYNLLKINYIVATCLFKIDAWREVGGYDEKMKNWYEDWEFLIRLGKNKKYGRLIREPIFCYRKHGNTMVSEAIKKHKKVYDYIKEKHRDLYSQKTLGDVKRNWNKFSFRKARDYVIYTKDSIRYKFEAAGLCSLENWRKHPLAMVHRAIPIGFKKKVNSFLGFELFDITYFGKKI